MADFSSSRSCFALSTSPGAPWAVAFRCRGTVAMKIKANVTFKVRYMIVTPSVREICGKCVAVFFELIGESRRSCEKGIKRWGDFALSNADFDEFFITLAGCCFLK